MVASTSATPNNGHARKQTVERAKATHLSRQLQLRLQYARLKVDHGWQKQNLNEVENLYFHHSHQRGAKRYPSPSMVATTLREPSSSYPSPPTNPPQSSLSFKLGPSSLSRTHTSASLGAETPPPEGTLLDSSNPHSTSTYDRTPPERRDSGPSIDPTGMRSTIQLEVAQDTKCSTTPSPVPHHVPSPAAGPSQFSHAANSDATGNLHRSDTVQIPYTSTPTWSPASRPMPSSSNHYPNVMHRHPPAQSSQSTMGPSDNSYSFSTSSTLTYDSFWSSHSSSAGSRSFHASPANMMTRKIASKRGHQSKVLKGNTEFKRNGSIAADICANNDPVPIKGIIWLGALPYMGDVLPIVATPLVLSFLPGLTAPESPADALKTRIEFCYTLVASKLLPTVPYADMSAWVGAATHLSPECATLLLGRKQDSSRLKEEGARGLPLCIIHGAEDLQISGKNVIEQMQPQFKNCEAHLLEGIGHILFWENPELVANLILKFVARVTESKV
ncbi:hypothetical protein D9615_005559 [Tricholomella constricta]|uniref:Uncharacterized protein n=1 Tax=Tricholomella constricta TaxID=117010 RepID=A0A8H5HEB8_9AGAR|nr:hypothetical protein D9615_005559 [Tricholomella constricta]